jgi:hypothetical protein
MQIKRDAVGTIPSSQTRELYGNLGGILIAPIDIILFHSGTFNPPSTQGSFNNANVLTSAGTTLGKIASSPWPPTSLFAVEPFVKITPNLGTATTPGIDLTLLPNVSSGGIPALSSGDSIKLVTGGGNISGSILDPNISGRIYLTFSFRVNAFTVQFNQLLLASLHGSRIITSGGLLIGMLIATQNNQSNGTCDALVFPADRI